MSKNKLSKKCLVKDCDNQTFSHTGLCEWHKALLKERGLKTFVTITGITVSGLALSKFNSDNKESRD